MRESSDSHASASSRALVQDIITQRLRRKLSGRPVDCLCKRAFLSPVFATNNTQDIVQILALKTVDRNLMKQVICLNKPFQVLSQFSDSEGRSCLADFVHYKGYYPAGRLDYDSEGLILLTNDGRLQQRISHPRKKMAKTYWVQIEGIPKQEDLEPLRLGIELKDGRCKKAKVRMIAPPEVWQRKPAIRERKNKPTSWLEIILTEGKNRQVRRMTAAIGFPTLRLIRYAIGPWNIETLTSGQWKLADIPNEILLETQRPKNNRAGKKAHSRPLRK